MQVRKIFILIILLVFSMNFVSQGQSVEYKVKAVFIEKFSRFIQWPTDSLNKNEKFIFGIIGEDPFGSILPDYFEDQQIKNRDVELRYFTNLEDLLKCDILFVSESVKELLPKILIKIDKQPTLTIGDTDQYAEMGIAINFKTIEGKLKFEINLNALTKANITTNTKLLVLAEDIYE